MIFVISSINFLYYQMTHNEIDKKSMREEKKKMNRVLWSIEIDTS